MLSAPKIEVRISYLFTVSYICWVGEVSETELAGKVVTRIAPFCLPEITIYSKLDHGSEYAPF